MGGKQYSRIICLIGMLLFILIKTEGKHRDINTYTLKIFACICLYYIFGKIFRKLDILVTPMEGDRVVGW